MVLLSDLIRFAWVVAEKCVAGDALLVVIDSRCTPTKEFSRGRSLTEREARRGKE
jgi:hypothetical protein